MKDIKKLMTPLYKMVFLSIHASYTPVYAALVSTHIHLQLSSLRATAQDITLQHRILNREKNSCFFATTDSFVLFFFVHKKTMLEIFYCFHNIVFYNIKYYVSYM